MARFQVSEFLSDEALLEVSERLKKLRGIRLDDLPLAQLRRWFEQNWQVQGSDILLPASVTNTELADDSVTLAERADYQTISFTSAVPPWELGSFDGNNILGVRIAMHGLISWTAGNPPELFLKPNGLATVQANRVHHRQFWANAGGMGHDVISGANIAALPGVPIGFCDWIVGAGQNHFGLDGILYTEHMLYRGNYVNRDNTSDGNRIMGGETVSQDNGSTAVTSLSITANGTNPTFSGRIVTEII